MQSSNREVLKRSLFLWNLVLKIKAGDNSIGVCGGFIVGWLSISQETQKFGANGYVAEAQNMHLWSTKQVTWMQVYESEFIDFHGHFLYFLHQRHC